MLTLNGQTLNFPLCQPVSSKDVEQWKLSTPSIKLTGSNLGILTDAEMTSHEM